MLSLRSRPRRLCSGPSRRAFLRVGMAGPVALGLPQLLNAADNSKRPAKSLIVFALEGGPSHIDLWDMKPDAPAEVRGEFEPIATTIPGTFFCEYLPMLAKQAH